MVARVVVIDSGGTARQVTRLPVVDSGGTTRLIQRLFVVDSGGTSRLVFQAAVFSAGPGGSYLDDDPFGVFTSSVNITFNSDGTGLVQSANYGVLATWNWVDPTSLAPGSYTARLAVNSGSAPTSGPAVDTDHALSSNRVWGLGAAGSGAGATGNYTVTLKDGDGNVVATATYDFTVQNQ
jgi:hypothetical protein